MAIDKKIQPENAELEAQEEIIVDAPGESEEVNIEMTEDGGALINPPLQAPSTDFYANLAEVVDEDELTRISNKLLGEFEDDKSSRKDWEEGFSKGLDLLGFKYDERSQPFQGASGVTHPLLAESVTQFQAHAYREMLPAKGPVDVSIVSEVTMDKEAQAERVKDFMNYQITNVMQEYDPEMDQLLFHLPLAGSAFKKVYYDEIMQRAVSKFVPADDIVVPYTATSLDDCESIIHRVRMTENELRKQQVGGFYRDIEINPSYMDETSSEKAERELDGTSKGRDQRMYTLLECHVNLDLEGFEDIGVDESPTGIKLPYVVTVEEGTRKI